MILSLLGMSVYPTKSKYTNATNVSIKEGEYINSTHAFLESFKNEKFIFLGTYEAIKKHKENETFFSLFESREVEFIEIEDDLQDIFLKIMNILISNSSEDMIFDITHSFRDSVIMSVVSTIVSQVAYTTNIKMIFAKEIEKAKEYEYELVGQDILNTSNISFLVTTFLSTLKVPKLNINDELYTLLDDFSSHLVSNQFKTIYEKDIPTLQNYIKTNQERLFFIKPLLEELSEMLIKIEETKDKENYEKFLFFSGLFLEKDYFLHSSTYLIEVLPFYVGKVLKDLKYIKFGTDDYQKQQLIVHFIKLNPNNKHFKFPNKYFLDINSKLIKEFGDIRDNVAEIRNNLAHINIEKEYGDIKEQLTKNFNKLKNLIKNENLYNLVSSTENKKQTVTYQIELYSKEIEKFLYKKVPVPSVNKVLEKYENNELEKLTILDPEKTKNFLDKNYTEIKKLIDSKKNKKLLVN